MLNNIVASKAVEYKTKAIQIIINISTSEYRNMDSDKFNTIALGSIPREILSVASILAELVMYVSDKHSLM